MTATIRVDETLEETDGAEYLMAVHIPQPLSCHAKASQLDATIIALHLGPVLALLRLTALSRSEWSLLGDMHKSSHSLWSAPQKTLCNIYIGSFRRPV